MIVPVSVSPVLNRTVNHRTTLNGRSSFTHLWLSINQQTIVSSTGERETYPLVSGLVG